MEASQLLVNSYLGKSTFKQRFFPQGQDREEWGSLDISNAYLIKVIKKRSLLVRFLLCMSS